MKRDVTYLYKPMGRTKGYFYGFAGILGERAKNAEQSATMRTVASIWRYELQGENAQDIAKLAGELCDKVSTSLIDLLLGMVPSEEL